MRSSFTTPKGTELPILNLRGKEYLQVQHRLVWFREEKSDWGIETEVLSRGQEEAVIRATIRNENGRIISQATKCETLKGFGDFIEKAETGAVGRALAMCGYGTQFTDDLDEGERLADSPVAPKQTENPGDPGSYIIKMGKKFKDMRLDACDIYELADFSKWLGNQPDLKGIGLETKNKIEEYLRTRETKAK